MGCGASAKTGPALLNDEQKQTVCEIACREMCIVTCTSVVKNDALTETIKVKPPDCVNHFREDADKIVKAGNALAAALSEATGAEAAGDMAKKTGVGGMFGSALGAVANVVDKAAEVGSDVAGRAITSAAEVFASGITAAVDKIQKPFDEIAKDVCAAKKAEIEAVMVSTINNLAFQEAHKLCRGSKVDEVGSNVSEDQTAITKKFVVGSVSSMATALLSATQAEIENHQVTKLWQQAIDNQRKFVDFINEKCPSEEMKTKFLDQYGPKKIELDLKLHIVTEIIKQMFAMLGEIETKCRVNPKDKSARKPKLFAAVFDDSVTLTVEHLDKDLDAKK